MAVAPRHLEHQPASPRLTVPTAVFSHRILTLILLLIKLRPKKIQSPPRERLRSFSCRSCRRALISARGHRGRSFV